MEVFAAVHARLLSTGGIQGKEYPCSVEDIPIFCKILILVDYYLLCSAHGGRIRVLNFFFVEPRLLHALQFLLISVCLVLLPNVDDFIMRKVQKLICDVTQLTAECIPMAATVSRMIAQTLDLGYILYMYYFLLRLTRAILVDIFNSTASQRQRQKSVCKQWCLFLTCFMPSRLFRIPPAPIVPLSGAREIQRRQYSTKHFMYPG